MLVFPRSEEPRTRLARSMQVAAANSGVSKSD